jgi:hypothetical protein
VNYLRCNHSSDVAILITIQNSTGGIIVAEASLTDSTLGIMAGQDASAAIARLVREGYKLECCEALATDSQLQYTFVNCFDKEGDCN